ncbi:MAG: hypothetical protein NVS3B13_40500 [Mucilaginibacter sp.]
MEAEPNQIKLLKALEERNAFIETVLQNLPIGIAVNKIDDGETTIVNKQFSETYGWPTNDLTDVSSFFKNVYPEEAYRNEIMGRVMNDIESGDPKRMMWSNITVTTQTGEQRVVNAKNIPLYDQNLMISTVTDVTNEYKQADEIRRTKANQDALINCIHDMIWSVDTNLHLITANHAFLETIELIIGEKPREGDHVLFKGFGDEQLGKWKQYYKRALTGEQFTVKDQHYNPTTQSIQYSSICLNPMINEAGDIFGVACYSQDITQNTLNILELQHRELLITQQNKQLAEIARMNAHDIRRPVASILGLIPLLKETTKLKYTKELLQYLEMATKELDTIIKRIIERTCTEN